MTIQEFQDLLAHNPDQSIQFALPSGQKIPPHFHITEVGRVRKDFIDCGGTVRQQNSCLLQVWVATDLAHRLKTSKLSQILTIAQPLIESGDLPVEVEYEDQTITQYPLTSASVTPSGILFQLGTKHTACLAPDKCGLPVLESSCCSQSGCC